MNIPKTAASPTTSRTTATSNRVGTKAAGSTSTSSDVGGSAKVSISDAPKAAASKAANSTSGSASSKPKDSPADIAHRRWASLMNMFRTFKGTKGD